MPPPICIVRRWARIWPRNTRFDTRERYSSFCMNSEPNSGMRGPRPGGASPFVVLRSLRLGFFEPDLRFEEVVFGLQQARHGHCTLLELAFGRGLRVLHGLHVAPDDSDE